MADPWAMSTPFMPNNQYMVVSWSELETAWRMLSAPEKHPYIEDCLQTVRDLYRTAGSERAILTFVATTAWLTADGRSSDDG